MSLPQLQLIKMWAVISLRRFINRTSAATISTGLSNEEVDALCKPADASTKDFLFQHTTYHIKDPRKSLPFYTGVLGMTLLTKLDYPEHKFSVYLMGYENSVNVPNENQERSRWAWSRKATLKLQHNWSVEDAANQSFQNNNKNGRGLSHIAIMVPDVSAACKRFEKMGVEFEKRPDDKDMKVVAFIKDPDGYCIKIFNADTE